MNIDAGGMMSIQSALGLSALGDIAIPEQPAQETPRRQRSAKEKAKAKKKRKEQRKSRKRNRK